MICIRASSSPTLRSIIPFFSERQKRLEGKVAETSQSFDAKISKELIFNLEFSNLGPDGFENRSLSL